MARSKRSKKEALEDEIAAFGTSLSDETKRWLLAIFFFALGALFVLAAIGKAGPVGAGLYTLFHDILFGFGYALLPITFLGASAALFSARRPQLAWRMLLGTTTLILSGVALIALWNPAQGGVLGRLIAMPLLKLFDIYPTVIILTALALASILTIFDWVPRFSSLAFWRKKPLEEEPPTEALLPAATEAKLKKLEEEAKDTKEDERPVSAPKPSRETSREESIAELTNPKTQGFRYKAFVPPPLSLLEKDRGKPGVGDIKANANIIKRTLQNFGIEVEMDEISIGPSVTRYALKPAQGVKLARIEALQKDLALALAAHPLRIEAPIPGRSLVGIEIPNTLKTTVGLGSLFATEEFANSDKPLLMAMGKDVSGNALFGNMAKMPHALIAGATGSGKSVTIHALITSLLFRNGPQHLRFIMIDPKRVELTLYNSIPHLLTPVITDPKKAILALKWAAKEMERRYTILENEKVRDIQSYHKNILEPALEKAGEGADESELPERLPYIVVIIDELADIMTSYPRELEAGIVRLAQMSRAVGIHLILSTQRPSVNVITGLIKANVPTRVALQVASMIDSRTIIDMPGAEKLLGSGDMLYMSGEMSKPVRLQSAFISETEVKRVVTHLANQYREEIPSDLNLTADASASGGPVNIGNSGTSGSGMFGEDGDEEDDLFSEAKEIIVKSQKASTTFLQRRLRIGYARAARLMDLLEEKGVVSAGEGAKPREVLIKADEGSLSDNTAERSITGE